MAVRLSRPTDAAGSIETNVLVFAGGSSAGQVSLDAGGRRLTCLGDFRDTWGALQGQPPGGGSRNVRTMRM